MPTVKINSVNDPNTLGCLLLGVLELQSVWILDTTVNQVAEWDNSQINHQRVQCSALLMSECILFGGLNTDLICTDSLL